METIVKQNPLAIDDLLVNRILAGEPRLFETVIRNHNQRLYRIGMSILKQDADTEDAMQNTYIKAFQNLDKFGNRAELGTWLCKIMINECLASKKKNQRFQTETVDQLINNSVMITPAHTLMNKELNIALETAVSQLPEKYRLVFVLREIEEMSVKETGEALNIEEANVKVRLNRAKGILQKHLNGYMKDHVYSYHLSRCDLMVERVFERLRL